MRYDDPHRGPSLESTTAALDFEDLAASTAATTETAAWLGVSEPEVSEQLGDIGLKLLTHMGFRLW